MTQAIERPRANGATVFGLILALGVPLALTSTGFLRQILSQYAPPDSLDYAYLREGLLWGLTVLVLLVLTVGERQNLGTIGFKHIRWSTLLWAVIGLVLAYLSYPLGILLLKSLGATQPTGMAQKLLALPLWLLALTILRAGVCEEILFRGYGIERLTALTGSRVIGAVVPGLVFMAGHIEGYGPVYALFLLPITVVLTVLYLFRRDLWTNIFAHLLIDGVGIATAYFAQHK